MKIVAVLFSLSVVFYIRYVTSTLSASEYLSVAKTYFKYRNVHIVTGFSCFSIAQHVHISHILSESNISYRFIEQSIEIKNLIDTPKPTVQGFVVDVKCPHYRRIFNKEDHGVLFKNNNFWLFLDGSEETLTILETEAIPLIYQTQFELLDILPISQVIFAKKESKESWLLYDVFKLAVNHSLEISLLGIMSVQYINECCESGMIQLSEKFQKTSTRSNLKGIYLNCGLVIAFPERFTSFDDPTNNHVDITTKATRPLVEILKEDLNYKCNIVQVDSYGWKINGSWNGAMGLYVQKRIQTLAHGTNMRADRLEHIEFTADLYSWTTPIIFRQPPLSAVSNIFILPLDIEVWKYVVISAVIIIIAMIIQLLHPALSKKIVTLDVVTMVWGAACQQGTHLIISTTSGRVVVLTTFLATLAIFTSYSASIVALLQSPSHSINDINDLIASPLKLSVQDAGYTRYNFMRENISILQKVYNEMVKPRGKDGWIYDEASGIEKVRTELFAFLVESVSAYRVIARTYTESEKCSLSEIQLIRLPMNTVSVERNSGYKELFKQKLRWHREIGLIDAVKRRFILKKPICEDGGRGVITVSLNDVQPAINFLLFGTVTSFSILLCEHMFSRLLSRFIDDVKLHIKAAYTIENK